MVGRFVLVMVVVVAGSIPMVQAEPAAREPRDPEARRAWMEREKWSPGPEKRPPGPRPGLPPVLDERFEQMLELAVAPEQDVEATMQKWPRLRQLDPEKRARFMEEVARFRERIRSEAVQAGREMGLQLSSDRESEFVRQYWQKRIRVERTLREEMEPRRRELTEQAREELRREFGPVR